MYRATFRFYAELNDFLPNERRQVRFAQDFKTPASIKDAIESLGVPHTEVDLILVNDESVDFSHRVEDGDRISVYPVFEAFDISPILRVRPAPLRESRFVLDVHLGRLASFLRILGFDTLYRNDYRDEELAAISHDQARILLTRDRHLLMRTQVTHGYLIRENRPRDQVREVVRRFDLGSQMKPFRRCSQCNTLLEPVDKGKVIHRIPPKTRERCDNFTRCPSCDKLYWPGTHTSRLQHFIQTILEPTSAL